MKNDNRPQRNRMLDIFKTIAIIAVVIGHSPVKKATHDFVYLFHLMAFFFAAGFGIKKERIATNDGVYLYLGRYIYKNTKFMVIYCCLFVILHNLFAKIGIVDQTRYSLGMIVRRCVASCIYQETEIFAAAMWFLPVLVIAVSITVSLLHLTEQFQQKLILRFLAFICCSVLALTIYRAGITLGYQLQVSILAIPVIFAGYFCKERWNRIEKYITWYGGVAAAVLMIFLLKSTGQQIELSKNEIFGIWGFYPLTYIGIYFGSTEKPIKVSYQVR